MAYNMSYCRFENTVGAMRECIEALDAVDWNIEALLASASSRHERDAMNRFLTMCADVAEGVSGD